MGGDGSKGISRIVVSKKTGKEYLNWKKRDRQVDPGGYPVRVRSGALRRLLFFTGPGESFGTNFDNSERDTSVKAGNMQAFIYNTAGYAGVIHEGRGSSSKFGPRRFLRDALENFNSTGSTVKIITEEIEKAIRKL